MRRSLFCELFLAGSKVMGVVRNKCRQNTILLWLLVWKLKICYAINSFDFFLAWVTYSWECWGKFFNFWLYYKLISYNFFFLFFIDLIFLNLASNFYVGDNNNCIYCLFITSWHPHILKSRYIFLITLMWIRLEVLGGI